MRTPSVQATFYKSLLEKFQRLMRITAPGKHPGRKASPASMAYVQSLMDAWKSLYPRSFMGKMMRFYRASTFGDRDKITHARTALHITSQYYAEKLMCVLRDMPHAKSCFKNAIQVGGMRTLEGTVAIASTPTHGGNFEKEKQRNPNDTWGVLYL